MKATFPLIAAGAMGVGAVLAFALPAGASVSVQSQSPPTGTVKLGQRATLEANGAVVFAPVKVVCRPGSYTAITVLVAENVGGNIASGTTYTQVDPCTGQPQSLQIAVVPTQKAFKPGLAWGQATLQTCDDSGTCKSAVDQHEITIVKKR
jgi:hypothetical protein